jgi:hypothetical protein
MQRSTSLLTLMLPAGIGCAEPIRRLNSLRVGSDGSARRRGVRSGFPIPHLATTFLIWFTSVWRNYRRFDWLFVDSDCGSRRAPTSYSFAIRAPYPRAS